MPPKLEITVSKEEDRVTLTFTQSSFAFQVHLSRELSRNLGQELAPALPSPMHPIHLELIPHD